MKESYLEVTYRHGRPLAAYYYLPRSAGEKSVRTRCAEPGLVIDYSHDDRPIGIEITAPSRISVAGLNAVLESLGYPSVSAHDLAPLVAA